MITGLWDLAENPLAGDNEVYVHVLLADTNGDLRANLMDMSQIKSMDGVFLDEATARFDLNLDGSINLTDMSFAKSRDGKSATCP